MIKMIGVLIIEDESYAVDKLKMLLKQAPYPIKILYQTSTVRESVAWLTQHQPDLIFCDIHLEDGSAFDIFEQIEVNIPIIFTTAYDQYALKAFQQKSIDYLLKPIDEKHLHRSLQKFQNWSNPIPINLNELKQLITPKASKYKRRFLINIGKKYETIDVEEIAYFYSLDGLTFIKTYQNRDFTIDYSLQSLTTLLDPYSFFHLNRNFIIGSKSIDHLYKASPRKTVIKLKPAPSKEVSVPEEKFGALKKWLNR